MGEAREQEFLLNLVLPAKKMSLANNSHYSCAMIRSLVPNMTLSSISSAPAESVERLSTGARSNLKDIDELRGMAALIVAAMHIRE